MLALLLTPTIEEAARVSGVSSKTVRRYLNEEEFRRVLDDERRVAFRLAAGALQGLLARAVSVLGDVVADDAVAPSVRVRACNSVLSHARAWHEIDEIEGRLDQMEMALEWP